MKLCTRAIVGTAKAQLRRFERALLEGAWQQVEPGVEVKLVASPEGEAERCILCRSVARQQKEAAIFELQRQRLLTKLREIDTWLRKRPSSEAATIERRIGRWLGRYTGAERTVDVQVCRDAQGRAIGLALQERAERCAWARAGPRGLPATDQLPRARADPTLEVVHAPTAG